MSNTETGLPETQDLAQTTPAKPTKKERLQRFRKDNPRIDYYPSEEAEATIEAIHKVNAGHGVSRITDYLVVRGYKAPSGNTQW